MDNLESLFKYLLPWFQSYIPLEQPPILLKAMDAITQQLIAKQSFLKKSFLDLLTHFLREAKDDYREYFHPLKSSPMVDLVRLGNELVAHTQMPSSLKEKLIPLFKSLPINPVERLKEDLRIEAKNLLASGVPNIQKIQRSLVNAEAKCPSKYQPLIPIKSVDIIRPSTIPVLGKIINWWKKDAIMISDLKLRIVLLAELIAYPDLLTQEIRIKLTKALADIRKEIISQRVDALGGWLGPKMSKIAQLNALESQLSGIEKNFLQQAAKPAPTIDLFSEDGEQGDSKGSITSTDSVLTTLTAEDDNDDEVEELSIPLPEIFELPFLIKPTLSPIPAPPPLQQPPLPQEQHQQQAPFQKPSSLPKPPLQSQPQQPLLEVIFHEGINLNIDITTLKADPVPAPTTAMKLEPKQKPKSKSDLEDLSDNLFLTHPKENDERIDEEPTQIKFHLPIHTFKKKFQPAYKSLMNVFGEELKESCEPVTRRTPNSENENTPTKQTKEKTSLTKMNIYIENNRKHHKREIIGQPSLSDKEIAETSYNLSQSCP